MTYIFYTIVAYIRYTVKLKNEIKFIFVHYITQCHHNTGMHTFHIIGMYSRANMPTNCLCMVHYTTTIVYI